MTNRTSAAWPADGSVGQRSRISEWGDLAEVSARFGAALRAAGLPVGPGRCERFAAAVTVARPTTPRALYLCALTTLVSSKDHALILRAVFDQSFGGLADADDADAEPQLAGFGGLPDLSPEHLLASAAKAAQQHPAGLNEARDAGAEEREEADGDDHADEDIEQPYLGTSTERLASKDFAELTDAELISVATLMALPPAAAQARRQAYRYAGHAATGAADRRARIPLDRPQSGRATPPAGRALRYLGVHGALRPGDDPIALLRRGRSRRRGVYLRHPTDQAHACAR